MDIKSLKARRFALMPEETEAKCAHGACDCPAEKGSKYCSEYCEEAEKSRVMEIGCGCKHPACR
jgi:hypothetical protein